MRTVNASAKAMNQRFDGQDERLAELKECAGGGLKTDVAVAKSDLSYVKPCLERMAGELV